MNFYVRLPALLEEINFYPSLRASEQNKQAPAKRERNKRKKVRNALWVLGNRLKAWSLVVFNIKWNGGHRFQENKKLKAHFQENPKIPACLFLALNSELSVSDYSSLILIIFNTSRPILSFPLLPREELFCLNRWQEWRYLMLRQNVSYVWLGGLECWLKLHIRTAGLAKSIWTYLLYFHNHLL